MNGIKGIAFDLYGTLFDVHSVAARCDAVFADAASVGRGREISALWRQKQLEYTWLRSLMNHYVDFEQATSDALRYTCRQLGLPLDSTTHDALCNAYLQLAPFPEVPDALRELKRRGLTLAILSNGSPKSIDAVVSHAGLRDAFDHLLSADEVQVYKPDHRVYEIAVRTLQLDRKEILFVSSNAWDATGARSFGFPVGWINRSGNVFEEMGQRPDHEVNGLQGVVALFD